MECSLFVFWVRIRCPLIKFIIILKQIATWGWDLQVETCAVCRNHIMELCIECQASGLPLEDCKIAWGKCNQFVIFLFKFLFLIFFWKFNLYFYNLINFNSAFHNHCLSRWLKTRKVCPLCNQDWEFAKIDRWINLLILLFT